MSKLNKVLLFLNIILLTLLLVFSSVKVIELVENNIRVGETIQIQIIESEQVDSEDISSANSSANGFDQLKPETRQKLYHFMKSSNLVIEPGYYSVNTSDDFDELVFKLVFRSADE